MKLCVYGASSDRIDRTYLDAGGELGRELARRGHTLVFGGGATGLMGTVVRGVSAEGGRSIGVSPKFFDEPGILNAGGYFDHLEQLLQMTADRGFMHGDCLQLYYMTDDVGKLLDYMEGEGA